MKRPHHILLLFFLLQDCDCQLTLLNISYFWNMIYFQQLMWLLISYEICFFFLILNLKFFFIPHPTMLFILLSLFIWTFWVDMVFIITIYNYYFLLLFLLHFIVVFYKTWTRVKERNKKKNKHPGNRVNLIHILWRKQLFLRKTKQGNYILQVFLTRWKTLVGIKIMYQR